VIEVEINNLQSYVPITVARVRRVARVALAAEQVARATVSIALTDNATIRGINRDYLQHDYDTDVLSFLFESLCVARRHAGPLPNPRRASGRHLDGEVVLSGEMAAATAGRFGWSPREELTLYLVHGLLHLCGYDDQTPRERRMMRGRERVILAQLGIVSRPNRARRRSARRLPVKNGTVP
jgi:probable rRNA maturation factor